MSYGRRDEVLDDGFVEGVDFETQRRENRGESLREGTVVGTRSDEVEEDVLRARGVFEDGVDCGNRATQVSWVKGHSYVNS